MSIKLVLLTSAQCHHCVEFRNSNGIPMRGTKFSPNFVKGLLVHHSVDYLLEVHVDTLSRSSQVNELNFYALSSSINEIKRSKDFEQNGDSLKRISFKRDGEKVNVEIDGVFSPLCTEYYEHKYIWNFLPDDISELRRAIKAKEPYPEQLVSRIQGRQVRQILEKSRYSTYLDDPNSFENYLLNFYFDFNSLVERIIPKQLKGNYEHSYPSWILVRSDEWEASLRDEGKRMYAKVVRKLTELNPQTGEISLVTSADENVNDVLESYEAGRLSLEFVERKKYKWQR